ncbi:MAG: hypothetical protein L3J46_05595 [Kangiellaceae bacterium]|nr:hypothetical protein [Kangiellaceae bacterium]
MKIFISTFLLLIVYATSCIGEESNQHHMPQESKTGIQNLSPKLQTLCKLEMQELVKGMSEINYAYISGDWELISKIAKNMENSYVLRKGLTKHQMHELHTQLPQGFLKLDEQFHYYSGMLSHASSMGKTELIGFYYSKMSESCVSCHSQYANRKFPLFKSKLKEKEHSH